ncbi:class I SAM-dependent methyltransferase [haloarchaeon 3A1-DGR]|nr:class I SAM-dependent methyltransferase [haloarchaeon 3A1-DGR]
MERAGRTIHSSINTARQFAANYPPFRILAGAPSEDIGGVESYLSAKIAEHLPEDAERILDVGGGQTIETYTSNIAEEFDEVSVFCSDIQDVANQDDINYLQSDACNLPYEDGTFDLVYSKSFFSHVWDQSKALDEQIRVLKPGGVLIIIDESLTNPDRLFDWLVLWPIRTSFERGGPSWLLNKNEVKVNESGRKYKDEDHHTAFYWANTLGERSDFELNCITSPYIESWPPIHSIAKSNEFLRKLMVSYSIRTVAVGSKL